MYAVLVSRSSSILIVARPLVWLGTINTFLIIIFGTIAQQTLQLPTRQYNLTESPPSIPRSLQHQVGRRGVTLSTSSKVYYVHVSHYGPELDVR